MGGDGGSIPGRRDLVKEPGKVVTAEDVTYGASKDWKWTHCSISNNKLEMPIVCDYFGNLFNKEVVLTHWYHKTLTSEFKHIEKFKYDVIAINKDTLKWNTEHNTFECPITSIVANHKNHNFYLIRKCGCVMSQKALSMLCGGGGEDAWMANLQKCIICGRDIENKTENPLWIIPLNPSGSEKARLSELWNQHKDKIRAIIKQEKQPIKRANKNSSHNDDNEDKNENDSKEKEKNDANDNSNQSKKSEKQNKSKLKQQLKAELLRQKLEINKSAFGKRKFPETIDRAIENKKKKSKVFASLFTDNQDNNTTTYHFSGGGSGGL
ncbi:hypothetical protein RFI_27834 [Reticulomyxa filosa]|uniref:Uncharacterized protein n=1 Tax=Reticulomyxa filosa TaxID=46433 RepID=X6M6K6_RETFI|nr:hypothetical protein RFI_27834 [Reticulomyxa filosa]|eukprot:ETO09544.1 hypothetical protein RFI_27834 [Reticulomyxa filosa]